MKKKKILAITSTRADSSPLMPVIRALGNDCIHYKTDGGIEEKLQETKPDAVLLLGDMHRTLLHAVDAANFPVPIIHLHGGEETLGAVDNGFRHAISKLSLYHFPCHEKYAKRLEKMGESPDRIFVYGALGIDNLAPESMTKEECEKELGIKFEGRTALICYQPETLGDDNYNLMLLQSIMKNYTTLIVAGCNADKGNERINEFWDNYRQFVCYRDSYPVHLWTSLMRHVDVCIGNSSSFIFETMTIGKSVIMIGDRQKGRYEDAAEFFKHEQFPFGKPGEIAPAIAKKILELDFPKIPRKKFYE